MADFAKATNLAFQELDTGEKQWGEDRARSVGDPGATCRRDSAEADCR